MAPNGGTCFILLFVACAALAKRPDVMPPNKAAFKGIAKKLMMKCQNKGYPVPKMMMLKSIFNNSDVAAEDRAAEQSNSLLPTFLHVLSLVPAGRKEASYSQPPVDASDIMNKMENCSDLSAMISMMRNSSTPLACYMAAFVGPLSWATLTQKDDNYVKSTDYDTLLLAVKPVLRDILSERMELPTKVEGQRVKKMMNMLREVYEPMNEDQRTQVLNWAKEQISQNYFNCTMRPSSGSKSMQRDHCKPSLKWLDSEALTMMGPFLSRLSPDDVDSSPKEKLCEFFRSAQFRSSMSRAARMKPSLGKKFLQRIEGCFSGNEFPEHVDKLGPLACYYDAPILTPDLSKKLLSQLDDCDVPIKSKLRKRLVNSVMSNSSGAQALHDLGRSVTLLSPKQLSEQPATVLKDVIQSLGPNVKWTRSQLRTLVKKQLGDKKCEEVSGEDLMALQSITAGMPSCVLKNAKAMEILNDREALNNISQHLRKGQLKTMLQGLREKVRPSELLQKLPGALLRSISLTSLDKANITSLEQVENKTWSRPQAAYLAKKMHELNQLQYRRLYSVLQGITCKMIDKVAENNMMDMIQAIEENPLWLSKVQTVCAAQKIFKTLERGRTDYFKTITEPELDMIPTSVLLYLPPQKVKDLPDSVCPIFLNKMEKANLSVLPLRALSRPAITQTALLCLGRDLPELTTADVSKLGPILCEVQPSKLQLMAPDVVRFSLQAMASCHFIPQRYRADLIQLVYQTFGSPSDWPAETMESLGPLLVLDDDAISALPNKPWMKDVLVFLRSRLTNGSAALQKKFFQLATTITSNGARKRRATNSDTSSNDQGNYTEPTEALIEDLGMANVYWKAAELDMMSNTTFLAMVEILGSISGYSADQLHVLSKKAVETFGPVEEMTESVVLQLGCVNQGFSNSDLEMLPFSLDSLEEIAHCGWKESQTESVWKSVAKYNNLTAEQLRAAEMVALNRFICGLNPSEIDKLNVDAFKDALGSMDDVQCSFKVTQRLKNLAVSVFGNPNTWTEARVSDLGNIVAGLDATEIASLDPSVFAFFSKSSISQIPPDNFAALSAAQLESLGPDNAAMVTSEQRAVLRNDQLSALENAETGSYKQSQKSAESGASVVNVEGICALITPLLLLFTGLLLL
ncbi:otoancorin [Cololabis saira]|uniref:otoancorin n=1 Tax=Cololabis saira TaxID=129043 RepID=UPI002AD31E97|nr:otoancorin [Cololabis saira]XP_061572832.1 otoancorin [Cololabis saira]